MSISRYQIRIVKGVLFSLVESKLLSHEQYDVIVKAIEDHATAKAAN